MKTKDKVGKDPFMECLKSKNFWHKWYQTKTINNKVKYIYNG